MASLRGRATLVNAGESARQDSLHADQVEDAARLEQRRDFGAAKREESKWLPFRHGRADLSGQVDRRACAMPTGSTATRPSGKSITMSPRSCVN